ncbi:MAG: C10 family peptidase, partial [Prevotella sp.]|nr:C10 family peptidase [Prevotella sp.]
MKKTLLFLSLFLLGFTNATQAQLRTDAEMMAAAKSALSNYPKAKRLIKEKGTNLEKLMTKSQVTIFGNEETGFAVIANDKRNPAIMGYSDSKIDVNNLAPGFVWWLEGANESLERMIATGQRPKAPVIKAAYRDHVDELLITKWGQQKPYNLMTPEYNVIGTIYAHYVTGCVATAMAQIMYYHKYPTRGKGQISYTMVPKAGTAIQINGNFNTKLDWDNMLPVYKEGSYTEAQANAVATLMKLCGASVKMQYTLTGSGAFTSDASRSMRKYFLYDEHMRYFFRDYFPVEEWMDIIFNEINNGFPILYGGVNSSGHEFI